MTVEGGPVIYWDASAILSVLFTDVHTEAATGHIEQKAVHLLSTLAHCEVLAVISRMGRNGILSDAVVDDRRKALRQGPWRRIMVEPGVDTTLALSKRWFLKGPDLWHLSAAKAIQQNLPELRMLTYDAKLLEACEGEALHLET